VDHADDRAALVARQLGIIARDPDDNAAAAIGFRRFMGNDRKSVAKVVHCQIIISPEEVA
jgi:hypothetical protein